jgi:hypothetical protein
MVFTVKKSIGFSKCLGTSLILDKNIFSLILQIVMTSADGFISPPLFFMSMSACCLVLSSRASRQMRQVMIFFYCFTTKPEVYRKVGGLQTIFHVFSKNYDCILK